MFSIANKNDKNSLSKIIQKLNMHIHFCKIPKKFQSTSEIKKVYNKLNTRDSEFDKNFLLDYSSQVNNVNSFEYDNYIIVLQTEMSLEPQIKFSISSKQLSKSEVRRTKIINDEMLQQMKYINSSVEKTKINELYKMIAYINLPIDERFDKKNEKVVLIPNLDNLQISYLNEKSERRDLFTKVLWVENLPMKSEADFNVFEKLSDLPYGVEVHVRVMPKITDYKSLKQIKAIRKTLKKHKRKNIIENEGVVDDEYNFKEQLAKIAQVKLNQDNSSLFYLQIALRVKDIDENNLKHKVSSIIKQFAGDRIELISNLSHDLVFAKELLPYHEIKYKKNIHKVEPSYFSKFNLLGGMKIGIDNENSLVQCYTKNSRKPVQHDHTAVSRGKTLVSTPNVGFFGQSGSGKSQGANTYMIYDIVYNDAIGLIIDPKGDRFDMDKTIPYSSEFLNLVVIGSEKNQAGAFDPFNVYDNDMKSNDIKIGELKLNVIDIASCLLRINNDRFEIKTSILINAFEEYIDVNSDRKTFTEYVELYLSKYSEEYAEELMALRNMMHTKLFFSTEDSKKIQFNSRLNVIVVDKIKVDANQVSKEEFTVYEKVSKMVVKNINNLIEQFYKHIKSSYTIKDSIKNKTKKFKRPIIMLEEVMTFVAYAGRQIISNTARMIRSFGGYIILCTQLFTDLTDDILEMLGTFFIGSAKSLENFKKICSYFNLREDKFQFLRQLEEKSNVKKEYPFLYVDPNGKKSIVEFKFLKMFEDAFDTHLKEDSYA